jgi:hypothetical protein
MWRKIKRFLQFSFGLLLSIAVILVGWSMLNEANFDLHDAQKYSGQITSRKGGKYFSFNLSGSPVSFNVYKPSRNYAELESVLNTGDSITVYFVNSRTANIQVYQIEKNGQIVVDKELLAGQNRTGGLIALIGGLGMLVAVFWTLRKRKYRFWSQRNNV